MTYAAFHGLPLFYRLSAPTADSEAAPVLFINGWCQSERYWQPTVARLAADRPCLTFDSRGFGRSGAAWWSAHGTPQVARDKRTSIEPLHVGNRGYVEMPQVFHTSVQAVADEARWLADQIFGARPLHVVGHSLGAVPAALVATALGERARSLTIINSGVFDDFDQPQGSTLRAFVRAFIALRPLVRLPIVRDAAIRRSTNRPIDPQQARWLIEDFGLADARLAIELSDSSLAGTTLQRYRHDLLGLPQSVRLNLIVGDSDRTIPPHGMYNLKRLQPDAHLTNFPDCGHLPMLERPAQFADTLAQALG